MEVGVRAALRLYVLEDAFAQEVVVVVGDVGAPVAQDDEVVLARVEAVGVAVVLDVDGGEHVVRSDLWFDVFDFL